LLFFLFLVPFEEEYNAFVALTNQELDSLDYALKIVHEEVKGDRYLVLVNVKEDKMTEIATTYTPTEVAYIRELVRLFVLT
jgi:hypothetical protein